MPVLTTDDGVKLHYEEVGTGTPIVFVHEFAGDCRSWEAQMRYFGRRYRCIAFNARGYPPSDVPDDVDEIFAGARPRRHPSGARRAQARQGAHRRPVDGRLRDAAFRLHLSAARAVRWSSPAAAMARPATRARSSPPRSKRRRQRFEELGMDKAAEGYASAPSRVQFQNKDPRGWREFADQLGRQFDARRGA